MGFVRPCDPLCSRVRCHIVHLSSAKALKLIQEARQAGAPLTVETTHHYLSLAAEDIPTGATQFKCCPPIRGAVNQVNETRCAARDLLIPAVGGQIPA